MRKEIAKSYEPKEVEQKWYTLWEERGYFRADEESTNPPFSIAMPPPNVTGSLHMGHALNMTLQDILTRWERMKGSNVLWLPGTDHAGIATQNVVERQLAEQGKKRTDLGREEFERVVWQWKETAETNILSQIRKLGCSCDWSRQRFTLDEGLSRAVREVFVQLYEEGLIYRGEYLVNWCPRCRTAISDLEVEFKPSQGKLWHIRYPIKGTEEYLVVATTRPETMLGDSAVAVHPEDERYLHFHDRTAILPLMNREIPIITDSFVEREFGTGAVKVTPGHDPNDFEMGRRHLLPIVKVIGEEGQMTEEAGEFSGLDRYQARKQVVAELEPALVGTPHSRLVLRELRRVDGVAARCRGVRALPGSRSGAGIRRSRHLVQLGPVALLHSGMAGRNEGAQHLLSHQHPRHRLRHHFLLGGPNDDDGPSLQRRSSFSACLHQRSGSGRKGS